MSTPFLGGAVEATPIQPPAYSLEIAADTHAATTADEKALLFGAEWQTEQIGGGGITSVDCPGMDTDAMGQTTNPTAMLAEPFEVFAEDHCTALQFQSRDYEARARRQLAATQSYFIAREFQLGARRDAKGLHNYALKDATAIHEGGGVGVTPTNAVAALEAWLGDTFHGARGMIHVTPQVLDILDGAFVVQKAGQRWITAMGTIVAADAGYTSEAGYVYAYASAPVTILFGETQIFPNAWNGSLQGHDYTTNSVRIYAERAVLIRVDGGITAAAGSGTADAMAKIQLNVTPYGTHS